MRHTISVIVVLAAIWLLNSGIYKGLLLSLGLLSVLFVTFIARRMDVVDHESQPVHLTLRLPGYYAWLAKQLVLANWDVVKRIWRGNKNIDPVMAKLQATQRSDMGKVIHANSITLTPGTVTIDIDDDKFLVHSLTRSGLAELERGDMDRRVSRLED